MSTTEMTSPEVLPGELPLDQKVGPSAAGELASNEVINASGHKQELERNFSLINICGVAITTGNTWTAIGGSVVRISLCRAFSGTRV